jgi:hypothetical protein
MRAARTKRARSNKHGPPTPIMTGLRGGEIFCLSLKGCSRIELRRVRLAQVSRVEVKLGVGNVALEVEASKGCLPTSGSEV